MNFIRTSLRNAPSDPTSDEQLEAMKRRAWIEGGVIAVRPSELNDDFLAQGLINHAVGRWGKRDGKA
jgi:hypothetical protein